MSEHVHDWEDHGCRGMFRCECGAKDFGDLCKPGELTAERAKVAELERALDCQSINHRCLWFEERNAAVDAMNEFMENAAHLRANLALETRNRIELEERCKVLFAAGDALEARAEAAEAKVARLREALRDIAAINANVSDCRDNDGCAYQSQWLADMIKEVQRDA